MKKSIRLFLSAVLLLLFAFSAFMFLDQQRSKAMGSNTYDDALALASSQKAPPDQTLPTDKTPPASEPQWVVAAIEEEDPHIQTLLELDLEALRDVNPHVVGWILIPDTKINYPLMQGQDNDYYLNHTWDGKKYAVGSIFLEYLSNPDLTDFNTIIYGHNMSNGSMFAGIRQYRTEEYWQEHPYVYIRSDQGVYRYDIFASYLADVEGYSYLIHFPSEDAREAFLTQARLDSVIETDIEPETTDRILTLSTCSGRGYTTRWVLHARLKMVPAEDQPQTN